MKFLEFIDALEGRLKNPLPAGEAHARMRAHPVGSPLPKFEHQLPPKPGSVLILLYEDHAGVIRFPLIRRPVYAGAHSGQISLPGGKTEPGENYIEAALREGQEEIGIQPHELRTIGRLSDFFVIPSNFLVTPVVAYASKPPKFKPDPTEVAGILNGDLVSLVSDEAVRVKEITAAGRFQMIAPHFEIDGEVVWGATAMILNELREICKEVL